MALALPLRYPHATLTARADASAHSAVRPVALPALTGLRFLAAAVVVAAHFSPISWLDGSDAGPAAVTLFFLLSGFILTYTARPGRVRVWEFYVARLARIYPAYLVGLGLAAALLSTGTYRPSPWCPAPAHALLPDVLLLQAWLPDHAMCLNGPAWSLSCEMLFYALFPFLLPLVRRIRTTHVLPALCVCWLVGLALPLVWIAADHTVLFSGVSPRLAYRVLYCSPVACLPTFVGGMLLGQLYRAGKRLPRPGPATALALALALFLILPYGVVLFSPLEDVLLWPAFAVLVLALAQGEGLLARGLTLPAVVVLGEASYGLYILHWPLHQWMERQGLLNPMGGSWPAFAAYSGLAVGLALLSLRFVETPARRSVRQWLRASTTSERR